MGIIVIAAYKPKAGKNAELTRLVATHVPILQAEGLVSSRIPIIMTAKDGTIIEVFEWVSKDAIDAAHKNPKVLEMWQAYEKVCDYTPISKVPETLEMFAEFEVF